MPKTKKRGTARTAAPRKPSPRGTSMPTTARIGTAPTRTLYATTGKPRPAKLKYRSDFSVRGPFWSDAMQAWRVEYSERDNKIPGGWYEGSFLCATMEDASKIAKACETITCRADWLALRDEALRIASSGGHGFIYRVMTGGEREDVIRREAK